MKYILIYMNEIYNPICTLSTAQADVLAKELEKPTPDPSSEELALVKGSLQTSLNEAVSEWQQTQP